MAPLANGADRLDTKNHEPPPNGRAPTAASWEYRVLPDQTPRRSLPNCLQSNKSSMGGVSQPQPTPSSAMQSAAPKNGLASSTWPLVRRNSCCGGLATSDFYPTRKNGFEATGRSGGGSGGGGGGGSMHQGRMASEAANALTTLLLR